MYVEIEINGFWKSPIFPLKISKFSFLFNMDDLDDLPLVVLTTEFVCPGS